MSQDNGVCKQFNIAEDFKLSAEAVLFQGDCLDLLKQIPPRAIQLVITSPPYNLGKPYEKRVPLKDYLEGQREIIKECVRVLHDEGSICWQVGNYVDGSEIIPLDMVLFPLFQAQGLKLRNRIVWHFEHGLHCSKRFSGRYETVLWFTKSNHYTFNLDAIRIPQKYPHKKYFKGPKAGQPSCNPLGKNPGDVWIIPNVKHNHPEKTIHPCQFPIELIQRFVLALTREHDWVLDPFLGVGTTAIAALLHQRKAVGAEIDRRYMRIARERINLANKGSLRIRPMERPIYDPSKKYEGGVKFIRIGREEPTLFELNNFLSGNRPVNCEHSRMPFKVQG
ncbi:MAG: site-specific DNA-methyltransferase [Candidatus Omnitrophica bacterium]|nr:site-specific DNA-methyltransferase [Candidatus Omnitrophota bacterium]